MIQKNANKDRRDVNLKRINVMIEKEQKKNML